jgi:hypothetical protein
MRKNEKNENLKKNSLNLSKNIFLKVKELVAP